MSLLNLAETSGLYKGILDFGCKIFLLIVAFLAPIKNLLLILLILIIIDLFTGLASALKHKAKISSAKLSRTVTKTLVYLFTIILMHLVSEYVMLSDDIPLTSMVSSFIILTELQSILENVNRLAKQNFLKVLIDKLSLVTKGREVPRKKSR